MKIAVPARDGVVDEHYGHCKEFKVFGFDDLGQIVDETAIPSAEGCGCKSGIAAVLAREGVTHLVAGNMGDGAIHALAAQGITAVRGAQGDAKTAALAFAKGELRDSGMGCSAHEHGHDCGS
jgi:Uncharacterized conserved protein